MPTPAPAPTTTVTNDRYQISGQGYSINNGAGTSAGTASGFGGINASYLGQSLSDATSALNNKLANIDVSDPGQLIAMQQQVAIYTTGLTVISQVSKVLEDTMKSIARNI